MSVSISAVIPVYNGEKFLESAVNSILKQTVAVDEIVIIDDGSTDNTAEKANELIRISNIPIRLFSQKNGGVSSARNLGLIKSSSDIIAFLDTDDLWLENKIEMFKNAYGSQHAPTELVFSDYFSNEIKEVARKSKTCSLLDNYLASNSSSDAFQSCFIQENFVGTASVMAFNRELALQIGGFNILFNYSEDFDFILRYSKFAEIKYISEALTLKREHDCNLSQDRTLYLWSHWYFLNQHLSNNHKLCRYRVDSKAVNVLKSSADEFLLLLCNQKYEISKKQGLLCYLKGFYHLHTANGLRNHLLGLSRKIIRTISFGLLRRA